MKIYVLLLSFLIVDINCENINFICDNGELLNNSLTCDGINNCEDGSDESERICFHRICSINTFRCHYGACVDQKFECDGKLQCADGSDESNCGRSYGSCELSEFKCFSGECISNNNVCDGKKHCEDGSDEHAETCVRFACPDQSFHCRHGGCINLHQTCNGFKDCIDGSDESDVLCKRGKQAVFCPPIRSRRLAGKCEGPSGAAVGLVPCDKPAPVGTVAHFSCKPYYMSDNPRQPSSKMVCQPDGTWNREVVRCVPDCGKAQPLAVPLILHGWEVPYGAFPWHATLYLLEEGNWTFSCGGSLISERAVLTAAHCTWEVAPEEIKVALGKHFSNIEQRERFVQIRDVERIVRHPLYQDVTGNYGSDIALLFLKKPAVFSEVVSPVCVDWALNDISDHIKTDKMGLILGMGITEKEAFSPTLKATYLPIVSDEECIHRQPKDFKKFIAFTTFCAGWQNGTGVCNGDSGGGLVFQQSDTKRFIVQGIVSVSTRKPGTPYCDPNYYTIFTKVGIYVEWIKNILELFETNWLKNSFIENAIIF